MFISILGFLFRAGVRFWFMFRAGLTLGVILYIIYYILYYYILLYIILYSSLCSPLLIYLLFYSSSSSSSPSPPIYLLIYPSLSYIPLFFSSHSSSRLLFLLLSQYPLHQSIRVGSSLCLFILQTHLPIIPLPSPPKSNTLFRSSQSNILIPAF